ncbi:TonB-dependent receptor [Ideonella sp. B508-1]|uniref:TonB-dependent receptor n=1 Tax=Ideonella sp. B508-1 TaxID=137716 RepID=UPI000348C49D|nr:TonB-dependent receptor [Ideonella sp. B508-1]
MARNVSAHRRQRPPAPRPTAGALAVQAALLSLAALPLASQAQTTPDAPQRIEITGSAIKRIDGETALPVQVITREEIDKAGLTTAAEIVAKLSANSNGMTDGASINVGGYDQKGMNSANLRGIGTSSTLVLLNGRRMANFASPGDNIGVDLNNIPAAAIQRVEVLLDGASSLYGTDAIGGVINFITRKDFQGLEIDVSGGMTQEGGAGKRSASLAGGYGSLDKDGFNVFGVFSADQTDPLRSSQRKFISDLQIPSRLPWMLSGYTNPGNIRLTADQRDTLQANGFTINGKPIVNRTINLSQPTCNPPANLYLPDGTGGEDACTYDFMRDTELYPKSEKLDFLGRGVLQLLPDHQLYGEVALTRSRTWYVGSSARSDGMEMPVSLIPELVAGGLDPSDTVTLRARLTAAGNRTSELTSTGQRYVLGLTGTASGWDYDVGLNHSVNSVTDADTHGYLLIDKLQAALNDGSYNPLVTDISAAQQAVIDGMQVNGVMRRARGTMDSVDFKASTALTTLDGGDLAWAVGGEFRRETQRYDPTALYLSDNVLGDQSDGDTGATSNSRNVSAIFTELDVPFTKAWDLQLGARADHYQGVGNSVNPKIGLRFQPEKSWLLRASAGTGFRAPSLSDLYRPLVVSSTATLPDPIYCAENDGDLSVCADNWETHRHSNAQLKPEKSRQFSLGTVIEPTRQLNLSLDYWNIRKSNLISELGDDIILSNLSKYGNLVHRYSDPRNGNAEFIATCGADPDPEDNSICYIDLNKENRGGMLTSGLDLVVDAHDLQTGVGTFGVRLAGTYVLQSKKQTGNGDPYVSNLGRFVTDGVVQRWRHRLTVDWAYGPYSAMLGNTFLSGYEDQNSAIDTDTGTVTQANRVKAYSLWDLSGAWQVNDALKLRGGIQNLFNTAPPFSNQAYYFISGYDPTYTDPRGRFFYAGLQYKFK